MMFKVGHEVECIKDAPWKGITDYCRVGDRGILRRIDKQLHNLVIFEMEITKGWNTGQFVPLGDPGIEKYFKLVGNAATETSCPPSLKGWLKSVQSVRT